jgi:hypothetical protein
MKMNSRVFCSLFVAFLCLLATAPTYSQQAQAGDAKKTVSAAGCVQAGVEAGCLVLKDGKTNTLYNLFFTGKAPVIDTAISFDGELRGGVTACMQGTAVTVTKWEPIRMHCPKEK